MRRFDDFSKFLLAIVVGQFFREANLIAMTVRTIAPNIASWVADGFPFLLAALAVRNVHASIQYDAVCTAFKCFPGYEDRRSGRVASFVIGLVTTIVAPALTEHLLASNGPFLAEHQTLLLLLLFGPYFLYGFWDVMIWLSSVDRKPPYHPPMEQVIGRWLFIDGFHLAMLAGWGWVWLAANLRGGEVDPALVFEGFFAFGGMTLLADYVLNRAFYFDVIEKPEPKPEPPQLASV